VASGYLDRIVDAITPARSKISYFILPAFSHNRYFPGRFGKITSAEPGEENGNTGWDPLTPTPLPRPEREA
jgi:hypothetical protein